MTDQTCQYICRSCGKWFPVSCKDYDKKLLFYCLKPSCQKTMRSYLKKNPPKKAPKPVVCGETTEDPFNPPAEISSYVPEPD